MSGSSPTKVCPMCAETISAAALICPYCQKRQNRRLYLPGATIGALIIVVLLLGGFIIVAWAFDRGNDFGDHRGEVTVLSAQMTDAASYSTNKELVVYGLLTNSGSCDWEVGKFEIRFTDKQGNLVDVATAGTYFTLPSHSEHAYRLSLSGRQMNSRYESVSVFLRDAKDPKM